MSIHQLISRIFQNNMGSWITSELASGMIRSVVNLLAAGVQQQVEGTGQELAAQADVEVFTRETGGQNGLV
ncbi:hypothetical protein LQZ44_05790 [Alcaligenes nematophilus]|uniref:hypothetical protein n=1 Tax=Alcaligenes nematophilus TaxID=2994643 RepID=UPI0035B55CEB